MKAMGLMRQDEIGRCALIDVLEEAVLRARPVAVTLRGGTSFIDRVVDVVTERGDDFAVFATHERVRVGDIAGLTRAPAAPQRPC
ncbi:MAG: hypothetical protein ACOZIN_19560 [Myxococcota bacterium]